MKKVYIAGPMSGYKEFNFPAFFAAEDMLTKAGYIVFNPARKDAEHDLQGYGVGDTATAVAGGFDLRAALTWDTARICEADAIYMLPGWEQSPGARAEHALAICLQKHYPDYRIIYG